MNSRLIALLIASFWVLPVEAQEEPTFKDRHPIIYKYSYPVRKTWNACVWVGEKTEPIHPFIGLCGAAAQVASPFIFGFGGSRCCPR